jgi:hypothetical protein
LQNLYPKKAKQNKNKDMIVKLGGVVLVARQPAGEGGHILFAGTKIE